MTDMTKFLEFAAEHSPIHRFILENGRPFETGPQSFEGERMEQGACFSNATLKTLWDRKLNYVEGYACVHGVPLQHAWCVDRKGLIVDPTWSNEPHQTNYFGVQFSKKYLRMATLKNGYYGLLDAYYQRKTIPGLISGEAKFR